MLNQAGTACGANRGMHRRVSILPIRQIRYIWSRPGGYPGEGILPLQRSNSLRRLKECKRVFYARPWQRQAEEFS